MLLVHSTDHISQTLTRIHLRGDPAHEQQCVHEHHPRCQPSAFLLSTRRTLTCDYDVIVSCFEPQFTPSSSAPLSVLSMYGSEADGLSPEVVDLLPVGFVCVVSSYWRYE
jgi:hypothetical protein